MSHGSYLIEPLDGHDRAAFSCGSPALDRYIKRQASQDARKHVSSVFVLTKLESKVVIGYYTLCSTSIYRKDLPDQGKGSPTYEQLPAILLGRLAVDLKYQGCGLGGMLLFDALEECFRQSSRVAAMAVVVDAKDELARSFYEQYGFVRYRDDLSLFITMPKIKRLLETKDQVGQTTA